MIRFSWIDDDDNDDDDDDDDDDDVDDDDDDDDDGEKVYRCYGYPFDIAREGEETIITSTCNAT